MITNNNSTFDYFFNKLLSSEIRSQKNKFTAKQEVCVMFYLHKLCSLLSFGKPVSTTKLTQTFCDNQRTKVISGLENSKVLTKIKVWMNSFSLLYACIILSIY